MKEPFLNELGLENWLSGSENNLRGQTLSEDELKDNITTILNEFEQKPSALYSGQQVHGHNIEYSDGERGSEHVYGKIFDGTDGLITDKEGVGLLVKFADCTPIVLYDEENKVLAAAHSGWRGTVQEMGKRLVERMADDYGSDPETIKAYVGPSIDQENYEVGPEVYEAFEAFPERDEFFEPRGEKYHLSMSDANISLLKSSGIKEENMTVNRESTFDSDRLHSSRQEGKHYALNTLTIMMPKN